MKCSVTIGSLHCTEEKGHDFTVYRAGEPAKHGTPHRLRNGWTFKGWPWAYDAYRQTGFYPNVTIMSGPEAARKMRDALAANPEFTAHVGDSVIRSADVRRAAFESAASSREDLIHPYGDGDLRTRVNILGMFGFDCSVGVDLMSIDPCCEFTPYPPGDSENGHESYHYLRTCPACGYDDWWSLHCKHELSQRACPECGEVPEPVAEVN